MDEYLDGKSVIKCWAGEIDDAALQQAWNLARLPFTFKHVALMPDVHMGYGMPIGGVLATEHAIIPNAVGVDIGCGVRAERFDLDVRDLRFADYEAIIAEVKKEIPVGFNRHKDKKHAAVVAPETRLGPYGDVAEESMGSLGGGNHFIELQQDEDFQLWAMIHSGSRGFGKQVADYWNKQAIKQNTMYFSSVERKLELAFLPEEDSAGYIREMKECVHYAKANRRIMGETVCNIINALVGGISLEVIDTVHNYAEYENHYNKNVVVHRKGAVRARLGESLVIPGSQGTASYVCEGRGNLESYKSCSHGAGRKLGRNAAKKTLDLEEEKGKLNSQGIIHNIKTKEDLDEAPGAYKDIDKVMSEQEDLVTIIKKLTPIAVVKG